MEPGRGKKRKKSVEEKEESHCPYVPEEIVVLILPRLPVKSLLRFRCVSKSWHSLISDPKFKLSTGRQQVIVMSRRGPTRTVNQWRFSIHLVDGEGSVNELHIPKPLTKGEPRLRGSCNGMLLVSSGKNLFLWNSLTRCCNIVRSPYRLSDYEYDGLIISGLCYDSFTDDYKIIMASMSDAFVMVGSFRNKTWKEIRFPYKKENLKSGPTVNDCVHWLVGSKEDPGSQIKPYLIVSFDPQTNEFVKVPMPQGPQHERFESSIVCGFGVLDGCLSLTLSTDHQGRNKVRDVEVLAMAKYGDKASWTSLFVISDLTMFDPINTLAVLLGSTTNGEVLIHMYSTSQWEMQRLWHEGWRRRQWEGGWRILAYNPDRKAYRDFPISNHRGQIYGSTMFVQCLLSPQATVREMKCTPEIIVLE
ncbi:F-box/kelch-repeat protein At3g23880-like [Rhododendron vialii]|uniref:F-box/kelch-repeat protein At3g23880-like n=1 Tax=Rhododendron vialii TaxID=182163 RepID=UPI00265D6A66|nr:F-box/kelch-repeat protein At3g23880-like [Rhododendron vialii]XP_058181503.1 F-box/kelch-repeat protein At3g23880-like [Rhododendron vialii]